MDANNENSEGTEDNITLLYDSIRFKSGQRINRFNNVPRDVDTSTVETEKQGVQQKNVRKRKVLSRTALTYELEKFELKILLIFNHIKVINHEERRGTEEDVKSLKCTFGNFGFTVTEYVDLTEKQIKNTLKDFTSKNLSNYGCIAVAVLTHGSYDGELMAADTSYNEKMIVEYLKAGDNNTLITKPRIVIIQACRGKGDIKAVTVSGTEENDIFTDAINESESYTLPMEADILVLHSCYEGNPAHRTDKGSWFIKTLCEEIDRLAATEDLESIITVVKRRVAIDYIHEKYDSIKTEYSYNKQMPVSTSTFTRKLYLRRYKEVSEQTEVSITARDEPSPQELDVVPTQMVKTVRYVVRTIVYTTVPTL